MAFASFIELFSMFHGLLATLLLMSFSGAVVALLWTSRENIKLLKYSTLGMFLTGTALLLSGAYIYISYRAPGGPRTILKEGPTPWVHEILFELKEFGGAYVPIMLFVATFLVWYYQEEIFTTPALKKSVFFILVATALWTLGVFGVGAYVTKLAPL